MSFQNLIDATQHYFPDVQVKYKDQSSFMKILGALLFFNPGFMTSYATTIGSTIYFPTANFVKLRPVSSTIVFLHELVHVHDEKKISKPLFGFLYLFPQILALLCLPLMFLVTWKIMLPLAFLFALPLPAFFRMQFERKAYLASLYVLNAFGKKLNFNPSLDSQATHFETQFKDSYYYFMWPFGNIKNDFDQALVKIKADQRPYEDPVFDMLDDLVSKF